MNLSNDLTSIHERLNLLENENSRFRRKYRMIQIIAIAIGAFILLIGATDSSFDNITVRQITITDQDGKVRGKIGLDQQGNIGQSFLDSNGTQRVWIAVESDDIARIRLFDDNGKARISSATFSKNQELPRYAGLTFYDEDGETPRINFGVNVQEKSAFQIFNDSNNKLRIWTGTDSNNFAIQQFYDQDEKRRVETNTTPTGYAGYLIFDQNDRNRLQLSTTPDHQVVQAFLGQSGDTKVSTVVAQDESVSHYIEKGAASLIWEGIGHALQAKDLWDAVFDDNKK